MRYKKEEVGQGIGATRKLTTSVKIANRTGSNVTLGVSGASPTVQDNIFHELGEQQRLREATQRFQMYLKAQREGHYQNAAPLQGELLRTMQGFFTPAILAKFRVLELKNQRLENPWFYPIARKNGLNNLPELSHMAVATFLDVSVFNDKITARNLFHGLVHAAQIHVLGVDEFCNLFVGGFLQARSYFLVPLKAHAFGLDARFAANPSQPFSVEHEIRAWWKAGRYS